MVKNPPSRGGRWERALGWGTHVNPWLIHVNVWQKPLQYCKVISLQLIQINEKKKKRIHHPMQGTQIPTLVRELRSNMPWSN